MNIGFYSYARVFNKNRMLANVFTSEWGGDNTNYPIALLCEKLMKDGHKLSTIDTGDINKYDKVIFLEYPEFRRTGRPNKYLKRLSKNGRVELYLLCIDTPAVKPNNWVRDNHKYFRKTFTWHDDYVDNKRYFRVHSTSHKQSDKMSFSLSNKKKLCVITARQKFSDNPHELYSERVKIIRWFEQNRPQDFDLFGYGWDEYKFNGKFKWLNLIDYYIKRIGELFPDHSVIKKIFNKSARFNYLAGILLNREKKLYPSYRGPASSLRATLKDYRFCICLENSSFPGWVTERIFDCFLSGCVPVYLGDPNIKSRIQEDAFIDMRKFKSYQDMYDSLKNMSENEYLNYIEAIKSFLNSDNNYPFTAEYFADTVYREIFNY
jgi:hypothetical protein